MHIEKRPKSNCPLAGLVRQPSAAGGGCGRPPGVPTWATNALLFRRGETGGPRSRTRGRNILRPLPARPVRSEPCTPATASNLPGRENMPALSLRRPCVHREQTEPESCNKTHCCSHPAWYSRWPASHPGPGGVPASADGCGLVSVAPAVRPPGIHWFRASPHGLKMVR